ncbi:MAG: hypothetical protein PVI57_02660 [Gemmatimonadota bacterium]|jgi:hypothetical protein
MRRRAPRTISALVAPCALLGVGPHAASGQDALPALVGGAGGLMAGGIVSVGIWTAEARFADDYLYAARDAVGWEALPVLVGVVGGTVLGLQDQDRLRRTGMGAGAGLLLGAALGTAIGSRAWPGSEGHWAGGVIGSAAGVLVGSVVGVLWSAGDGSRPEGASSNRSRRVPIAVSIPIR